MKIIYNLTANVHPEIVSEWLKWMKEIHLQEVIDTGCFSHYTLSRMISHEADEEWQTFVIQYFSPSLEMYKKYEQEHAPGLRSDGVQRFSDKVLIYRSLMEQLN